MNPDATARLQDILSAHQPDWYAAQRTLLEGADLDAPLTGDPDLTILANACRWNRMVVARWLLDQGAHPDASTRNGDPALLHAALGGNPHIAALLLDHRADPNIRTGAGWTIGVATSGYTVTVRAHGWTVMMVAGLLDATESTKKEFIATLLDHGADPAATTPDGRTAPEIFMTNGCPKPTGYLDEALTAERHAAARRRLLDRLTADQRTAWLPKSCAAEAAIHAAKAWGRKP